MLKEKFLNLKPEKVFLLLSIIFGFLFLVAIPPYQLYNDSYNFYHLYNISEFYGNAEKESETVPVDFVKLDSLFRDISLNNESKISPSEIFSLLKQKSDTKGLRVPIVNPASQYSFTYYIPQVIGVWMGKLFSAPPIIIYNLSRLFALISWIVVIYYAIKIIPLQKYVLVLIALTPISVLQGVSVSSDSVANSISFLIIAFILRLAYDDKKEKVFFKDILLLSVLSVIITNSKPHLLILLFLYFLIPAKKLDGIKKYILCFSILLIINLLFIFIRTIFTKTAFSFAIENPYSHFLTIFKVPDIILAIYLMIVLFTSLYDKSSFYDTGGIYDKNVLNIFVSFKEKMLLLIIAAAFIFTIFYLLTPQDTKVMADFHGKYFIPLQMIILLLFYNNHTKMDVYIIKAAVLFTSFITLLISLIAIINRYYIL